jgi:hypothetical protein
VYPLAAALELEPAQRGGRDPCGLVQVKDLMALLARVPVS